MKLALPILVLIAASAYAATEIEPNDSAATANPIVPGDPMTGQLASASDQDWFGFTTAGPTTLTVTFTSAYSSNTFTPYLYYTIQVRNAAGTVFASADSSKNITFLTGLASAGTYYIVVREGPDNMLETRQYWLTATTTPTPSPSILQAQIYPAVELAWNSTTGKSYQIEWTASLSPPSWFPLSSNLPGTGSQMSYFAPARTQATGFYRVKEY